MVHSPPSPAGGGPNSAGRSTPAILLSVWAFLSLLTEKACQVSKKLKLQYHNKNRKLGYYYYEPSEVDPVKSPRTPIGRRPKELFTSMSNKAIKLVHCRKKGVRADDGVEEDFGDGGVWQRAILMGDRCQPLDFSGVIYYDENGRKISNLPIRSPRASPMPGRLAQRNF